MEKKILEKWKLSLKVGDSVWFINFRYDSDIDVLSGTLVHPDPSESWGFRLTGILGFSGDFPWYIPFTNGNGPTVYIRVAGGARFRIASDYVMRTEVEAYRRLLLLKRLRVKCRKEEVDDRKGALRSAERNYKRELEGKKIVEKKLQKLKDRGKV